ncbi:MAG: FHA domain-containing protein [Kiritimatiellia bacterium]|nr:FHA domain-containing protein [Kiritimatiellia bacterium]
MASLIGMSGSVKGQKFDVNKDRTTIGRAANNDIMVQDEAVSSQHCYISRRGNSFILHDLNSTNGTTLNLQPVLTEATLQNKQVIQVGASELMFEGGPEEGVTSSIQPVTEVVVEKSPVVTAPKSFSSVSPFGARYKSRKGLWLALVMIFGLIVLIGMVLFCIELTK